MKILIVGSGGREHALAWSFKRRNQDRTIFCADGNAGISNLAECVDISPDDIEGLAEFAANEKIDLTFVGGETSLALGIVDRFEQAGLQIIGPTQSAARLESSKAFAKDFMEKHRIPTAAYANCSSAEEAITRLESGEFGDEETPVVVKADGLAAGKGVVVAVDRKEAIAAVNALFEGHLVSKSAVGSLVLEECLFGKEVSLIMFSDGKNFALMPPTRDHKRIGEGDTGDNTGGMGTVTDSSLLSKEQTKEIADSIIRPTLEGAAADGFPVTGILFLGLMMTEDGPKVLEYNVRFGDPETQAILVNLETDLAEICDAMLQGSLDRLVINWKEGSSACVILAAENYPKTPRKGDRINGLEEASASENVVVFHSGTAMDSDGYVVTAGGRVLGVTAVASNLSNSLHRAYKAANKISWEGMYFRRDIGK
ncbi:MAG: phosphoribosylamine--glycine ligase [Pyrinomonadaceae bacterium]|nr:phosphoribosylamine--glycine ligase [Pyrinomonadaceae bacterium]